MNDIQRIEIELEVDAKRPFIEQIASGSLVVVDPETPDVSLTIRRTEEGQGFGFTEVVSCVVAVGVGVSSELVAAAIRSAIRGVIRRARTGDQQSDGSREDLTRLVESAREDSANEVSVVSAEAEHQSGS